MNPAPFIETDFGTYWNPILLLVQMAPFKRQFGDA